MNRRNRRSWRGHSVLEMALFAPWLFFTVVGALDWGFYSYALISTESAARVAAEYTSGSSTTEADATDACTIALRIMKDLPNVGSSTTTCSAAPVKVTATSSTATDGSTDSVVSVQYTSSTFIPIPGLLTNKLQVTRTVKMRVRS